MVKKLLLVMLAMFIFSAPSSAAFMDPFEGPALLPVLVNPGETTFAVVQTETWEKAVNHVVATGEFKEAFGMPIWIKGYDLGTAVPKHGILPHRLRVTMNVIPQGYDECGVRIQVSYRREMGGGYVATTLLYMHDADFDMRPDKFSRRYARSLHGQFFLTGPRAWKTPIYDIHNLPINMEEWNHWLSFFLKKFGEEGAFEPHPEADVEGE